ncbi:hypothetical protein LBMAG46_15120 [Planctomycetia bacterium]|nr:hypothetical protein LBMAG46_15120 [Planctomycetia bacterium]
MLRSSLVALAVGVLAAGSLPAQEKSSDKPAPQGIMGWLKNRGDSGAPAKARSSQPQKPGVERAVVSDAEKQSVSIRRTAGSPQDNKPTTRPVSAPAPAARPATEQAEQPRPIRQAPVVPNASTVTGPQYFSAAAPGNGASTPVHPGRNWQTYEPAVPARQTAAASYAGVQQAPAPAGPAQPLPGYPQTGASLYPAPVAGIPQQMGGAVIANPALQPHEMLYAHQYKALYPPYYYEVNGGWFVTPFGVWSQENWKLKGTQVDVKYRSSISPFAFFTPPVN